MVNSLCKWWLTWSPKRVDSTNQKRLPADAHAHRDVFQARLPWETKAAFLSSRRHNLPHKVRLCNNQTARTERLHVDATIMRYFQTELFSSFLPSTHAGHVNLAAAKPWQFMPN